jgi:hypothetical protein
MLAPMLVRAAVLLLLVGAAFALAARRARELTRMVRLGRPVDRSGDLSRRAGREATEVLGQRKLLQRFGPGFMHALIFWGFLILLTTILEVGGQVVDPAFELPIVGGTAWLGFLQDLLALGVLFGIAIALTIRLVQRPERFVGSHGSSRRCSSREVRGSRSGTRPRPGGRRSRPRWRPASAGCRRGCSGRRCGPRSGSTS